MGAGGGCGSAGAPCSCAPAPRSPCLSLPSLPSSASMRPINWLSMSARLRGGMPSDEAVAPEAGSSRSVTPRRWASAVMEERMSAAVGACHIVARKGVDAP